MTAHLCLHGTTLTVATDLVAALCETGPVVTTGEIRTTSGRRLTIQSTLPLTLVQTAIEESCRREGLDAHKLGLHLEAPVKLP
jgi:hypothetical protein